MKRFLSIFAAVGSIVLLTACKDSNGVTDPGVRQGPPATPTPASAAHSDKWDVRMEVVEVSGPDFCINLPRVGGVHQTTYTIQIMGGTVSFSPEISEDNSYVATLQATSFTASVGPFESANGMCAHYFQSWSLSGTLSPDFTHLTATETWSFRLDSGQVKTVKLHWDAARR